MVAASPHGPELHDPKPLPTPADTRLPEQRTAAILSDDGDHDQCHHRHQQDDRNRPDQDIDDALYGVGGQPAVRPTAALESVPRRREATRFAAVAATRSVAFPTQPGPSVLPRVAVVG